MKGCSEKFEPFAVLAQDVINTVFKSEFGFRESCFSSRMKLLATMSYCRMFDQIGHKDLSYDISEQMFTGFHRYGYKVVRYLKAYDGVDSRLCLKKQILLQSIKALNKHKKSWVVHRNDPDYAIAYLDLVHDDSMLIIHLLKTDDVTDLESVEILLDVWLVIKIVESVYFLHREEFWKEMR